MLVDFVVYEESKLEMIFDVADYLIDVVSYVDGHCHDNSTLLKHRHKAIMTDFEIVEVL